MSLINFAGPGIFGDMFEDCVMMDRTTQSDGAFGMKEVWVPGAPFQAMLRKDNSTEAQIAERQGMSAFYTVVVRRGIPLKHQDVFRRESDGTTFRVTGSTVDNEAPDASTVQIAKVTAERWDIPNG